MADQQQARISLVALLSVLSVVPVIRGRPATGPDLHVLTGHRVRSVLRSERDDHAVVVIGTAGEVLRIWPTLGKTKYQKQLALRAALEAASTRGRGILVVRDAVLDGESLLALAGLHIQSGGKLVWRVCAICKSTDLGGSWELLETTRPECGEEEIIALG